MKLPDFWIGSEEGYKRVVGAMAEQIKIDGLNELFPYEYKGGGYFREKGIAQGKSAKILHGMEAIKYLHDAMTGVVEDEGASE